MENITSSKIFTTRQGTIGLGVIAAIIAAVLLIVYLNNYRNSVNAKTAATPVLVAKSLIPQNTSGDVVGSTGLYKIVDKPKDQIISGAFVDPSSLNGTVALTKIFPGSQLTAADFGPAPNSLTTQLGKTTRAVVVPLDSPGEVGGQISAGDHVDVWVLIPTGSTPSVREVLQNMTVLNAPANGGNITMLATPKEAGELMYASANARIWLALRSSSAKNTKPTVITANDLLKG